MDGPSGCICGGPDEESWEQKVVALEVRITKLEKKLAETAVTNGERT